jgi:hypothetical protein
MSVFSWSLLNRTKDFSGVEKIVAQSAMILPTSIFYRVTKNTRGVSPSPPAPCVTALDAMRGAIGIVCSSTARFSLLCWARELNEGG